MTTPTQGIQYQSLREGEIRLVDLCPDPDAQTGFLLQMRYALLQDNPEYYALSYVWGDANQTKPIGVDNAIFHATENLYHALSHFTENIMRDSKIPLWIDALCLNQRDTAEKEQQVPNMGQIFSSAVHTVVWLGRDAVPETSVIGSLAAYLSTPDVARELLETPYESPFRPPCELDGAGNGDTALLDKCRKSLEEDARHVSAHLMDLAELLKSSWFSRVWTIQEFVLSRREPVFMPGKFNLAGLRHAYNKLKEYESFEQSDIVEYILLTLRDQLTSVYDLGSERMTYLYRTLILPHTQELSPGCPPSRLTTDMLRFLAQSGSREVTLPHDRIYGLLGMMPASELPTNLKPDYSKPFGMVYQEYIRFLVEGTGNLDLICGYQVRLAGYPSWVRDLGSTHSFSSPSQIEHGPNSCMFSSNGCALHVQGFPLGDVIGVSPHVQDLQPTETPYQFDSEILPKACQIRGVLPEIIMQEIFGEDLANIGFEPFLQGPIGPARSLADLLTRIRKGLAATEPGSAGAQASQLPALDAWSHRSLVVKLEIFMVSATASRIVVGNGDIYCTSPDYVADLIKDQVWVLKGAQHPITLRSTDDRSRYEVVGAVLTPTGDRKKIDRSYLDGKKLHTVTIV